MDVVSTARGASLQPYAPIRDSIDYSHMSAIAKILMRHYM